MELYIELYFRQTQRYTNELSHTTYILAQATTDVLRTQHKPHFSNILTVLTI
jgi:hypothetical protein